MQQHIIGFTRKLLEKKPEKPMNEWTLSIKDPEIRELYNDYRVKRVNALVCPAYLSTLGLLLMRIFQYLQKPDELGIRHALRTAH